jgi:hypothetical protein
VPGLKLPCDGGLKIVFDTAAGTASIRLKLLTVSGPLLVTVIVDGRWNVGSLP